MKIYLKQKYIYWSKIFIICMALTPEENRTLIYRLIVVEVSTI